MEPLGDRADDMRVDRAAGLIDELAAQQKLLAAAQARQAVLMLEFAAVRGSLDQQLIAELDRESRFEAGEFASTEIALAITASRHSVQRSMGIARRLREECPDAYDAWRAGDIDLPRAIRINRAMLRLTRQSSKQVLNATVVDVAVCKTAELLGRWLNEFVAKIEPDQVNERMRRSFEDRYASVRPDLDGISFLSAALSSMDAGAIDQILDALARAAGPDDPRNMQQRRADALVDLVLGRVANGCHVAWVDDVETDDVGEETGADLDSESADWPAAAESADRADDTVPADDTEPVDVELAAADEPNSENLWDIENWDLPASAFRPEPCATSDPPDPDAQSDGAHVRRGRAVITSCNGEHPERPIPAVVGVVVSVQSLLGHSETPGQLIDRSGLVPADIVRNLAQQPGTLFYRLLTDEKGNLLDVTEMGRFPSRRLGAAVRFRDATCAGPVCHTSATHSDLDHMQPVPEGPTNADNLTAECRPDHRAKTHAGHQVTRDGPSTTIWTTPTGHSYRNHAPPFPVEKW